jgi:hypothetical protein
MFIARETPKALKTISLLAVCTLAASAAFAQSGPAAGTPAPAENPAVQTAASQPPTKPIVRDWHLKKLNGNVNLTLNPDGTFDYSGNFADKKPGDDWDCTLALKSSTGAVVLFHYEGDAANGVKFSKQGRSAFIADEFPSFAKGGSFVWVYKFRLSAAGRRKHYEEMEEKRAKLREEAEEAAKRHDKQILKQKEQEERQEAKAEVEWEEGYVKQHPQGQSAPPAQNGGGGGGNPVNAVVSTISSAVNSVGSVVGDIAGLF